MMTCGLTVTRSAGRFCINRFFFTFEHMIGSVSVTCLTCSRMSALRMSAPAMGSTHQYSYDELELFLLKKSFWHPVHQLIASKVSFLDEAMLSYFLVVCELAPSHPFFFFSRIRFSFRIFKMRGFVSPAVHHSNAYPAQSCKSATLTRVTTGSQHDFIMP